MKKEKQINDLAIKRYPILTTDCRLTIRRKMEQRRIFIERLKKESESAGT